jgi:hypothetical protein
MTRYLLAAPLPDRVLAHVPDSILLAIGAWTILGGGARERRGVVHVLIPAAAYLVAAMAGGMSIGVRHALPVCKPLPQPSHIHP